MLIASFLINRRKNDKKLSRKEMKKLNNIKKRPWKCKKKN
jgi:hypothetical protein